MQEPFVFHLRGERGLGRRILQSLHGQSVQLPQQRASTKPGHPMESKQEYRRAEQYIDAVFPHWHGFQPLEAEI